MALITKKSLKTHSNLLESGNELHFSFAIVETLLIRSECGEYQVHVARWG